jgi:hypothetical protein
MERVAGSLQLKAAVTSVATGGVRQHLVSLQSIESEMSADNGPGIAPDQREKVFVPFYTTKRQGQWYRVDDRSTDRNGPWGKCRYRPDARWRDYCVIEILTGWRQALECPDPCTPQGRQRNAPGGQR